MKEAIKKEILYDVGKAVDILKVREKKDIEELRILSEHAIEDIAVEKDLELVSVSVLLYSLYKVAASMDLNDYKNIIAELESVKKSLQQNQFGRYNRSMKTIFEIIRRCNVKIGEHLQDVLHAARIKKGTSLLQRGLSIGQAAGIMGLNNWDLQQYAGKSAAFEEHHEGVRADKRVQLALRLFGV